MNKLLPLAAIGAAAFYETCKRTGRGAKASDPNVTAGKLQFYRGSPEGVLDVGRGAFFSSNKSFAGNYGPVKKHRLYLRNPKFVTRDQWLPFDSDMQKFSPGARTRAQQHWQMGGYDGVVWVFTPARGDLIYSVYAFDGAKAVENPHVGYEARLPAIRAAFQEALETHGAEKLTLLRRVAKRLKINVRGLSVYRPDPDDRFREIYDASGIRVWYGFQSYNNTEAKSEYIEELIRQKIDVR